MSKMHEVSIVYDTIQMVEKHSQEANIKSVDKIILKVGEFTCVKEDSLIFAFESLSENTICDNAKLIIDKVGAKAYCDDCKEEFSIDFMNKTCPKCNKYSNNITSGYELILSRIEGE